MQKKIHFRTFITALSIGVLLFAVASMFIMNFEDTNSRVERLTQEYIKNGTVQNTETLEGIFSSGIMSLDSIGKLYGEIEQKEENISNKDIKRLTEEVWFDRLIFVDETGWGFDGEGHYYNFTESPNVTEAMKGNIGIGTAFVYNDSAVNQLCYYAPVKNTQNILGMIPRCFCAARVARSLQVQRIPVMRLRWENISMTTDRLKKLRKKNCFGI